MGDFIIFHKSVLPRRYISYGFFVFIRNLKILRLNTMTLNEAITNYVGGSNLFWNFDHTARII